MRILMIHDVDDWSFHNISRNIQRVAAQIEPGKHEFRSLSRADWAGRPKRLWDALEWSELHVFFWRFDLIAALDMLDTGRGARARLVDLLSARVTLSVVYDHLYMEPGAFVEMGDPFAISDLIGVSSGTLDRLYRADPQLPSPDYILEDGVSTERFSPAPASQMNSMTAAEPLRVGWVGNSQWGDHIGPDLKGFHGIFLPAVEQARAAGANIRLSIADKATHPVPAAQMPDYYRGLDVYLCTSEIEGTPNPVLEAMATGVAIVSTDVGLVRDVLGPLQQDMIVARDADAMANCLIRLNADRALLAALKAENLARRDSLTWENRYIRGWGPLFDQAAQYLDDPARQARNRAALQADPGKARSRLSRTRARVFRNRALYLLYMTMIDRTPGLLRAVRGLFGRREG